MPIQNSEADRVRLSWQGCGIVSICSVAIAVATLQQGEPYSFGFCITLALTTGAIALYVRRYGGRIQVIGHGLLLLLVGFLGLSGLAFGGYAGGAPLVTPAVAAIAYFLVGARGAVAWTLALIALNTGLMIWVDALPPTLLFNNDNGPLNHVISSATALAVLAVAQGFAAQEQRRTVEAQQARELAERARELADLARQEAEAASHAKSIFLAMMSHELRTPLNAVVGAAQLLPASQAPERDKLITIIQQAGLSLAGQIEEVLDFSRIESSELTLLPVAMDPVQLLQQVQSVFSADAASKGLRLFLELPAQGPGQVLADPDRMRQVLLNLVGNAVKFTERGHVRVGLRILEGSRLCFVVEDTGPGIAACDQDRIFEPFQQLEEGLARRHGGFGLGLAISRGIAQQMDGTLTVTSSESGGCRFVFEVLAPEVSQPAAKALIGDPTGMEVLLVEDNAVNLMIARAMLERIGCTVRVATDGLLAVAAVRAQRPDLVLMDLQMPNLDGLGATRIIREFAPELPIIVLSANAFAQDRASAIKVGANGFLSKPVLQEELHQALIRWGRPTGQRPHTVTG